LSTPLNSSYYYDRGLFPLTIEWGPQGVVAVQFQRSRNCVSFKNNKKLKEQLNGYFSGRLRRFTVTLDYNRASFSGRVMTALLKIPYGRTISYGRLAALAGFPGAARAVGTVMAKNPIPIFIPCHRVVLANGKLGRYGGGVAVKRLLLGLEGAL